MSKLWIVADKKSDDLIDQLLINRNIDLKNKESFLNPDFERDINDPFLLDNMDIATDRIIKAISSNEKIGIFADFDADGITSAAIIANFFNQIKFKSEIYIPSREAGYGLNEAGILELYEKGCKLIITVDLGITGKKYVDFAKNLGIDMIITDHHLIQDETVPTNSLAIIHPKMSVNYPFKELSGGGVAWKLVCALIAKINKSNIKVKNISNNIKNYAKWSLDLTAISTVCDMMVLTDENRSIVKYGLTVLKKTKNIGLEHLINIANIDRDKISAYTLGFQIGPRINAPGRMDHAQASYFLLTTNDKGEASELAQKLNQSNIDRQEALDKVVKSAKQKIIDLKLENNKIIILSDKNWDDGLLGLAAGRICDELSRPAIIFNINNDIYKGSARSTSNFHILNAIKLAEKYLLKFGGHAGAAGLTLKKENFDKFYELMNDFANKNISDADLQPRIKIDLIIDFEKTDIDVELVGKLKMFEPFGMGNPRPIFVSYGVEITELRWIGNDKKHLKLKLLPNKIISYKLQANFDAIMFNCKEVAKDLNVKDTCDIVYSIDKNEWNGNKTIQFNIIDIKKSE